jgi:D-alanyl-D-alanine-carboxypeptidase/D-alanyl-D-alanine-endopeptidase
LRGLLALALLAIPAALPVAAQTLPPLPTTESLGQDLYLGSGSTAMVLVVVRGDRTIVTTFGETFPGSHQLPTSDSLLRLCSLTKIFTTDVLVKLVQSNLVRLDTPLQSLAPNHRRVPVRVNHDARPITLGDLATHTAGLPREIGSGPPGTAHFTYPGPETRWAWLSTARLRSTPGTVALYSNLGFDLLSDALAQAAHIPYPQLLAAHTLSPLGLSDTTFTPTPQQCARLLLGAESQGPCTDTTNTGGSSGLYSTPADMGRFLQYLLGGGRPFNPNQPLLRQSPTAQAVYLNPGNLIRVSGLDHAGDPTGIGLGWIHTPGSNNTDIVEKTGGGAGFLTYIAMLPAQRIGLFLAATNGPAVTHFNLFRNANNVLLTMAGLPSVSIPPPKPPPAPKRKQRTRRRQAGASQ